MSISSGRKRGVSQLTAGPVMACSGLLADGLWQHARNLCGCVLNVWIKGDLVYGIGCFTVDARLLKSNRQLLLYSISSTIAAGDNAYNVSVYIDGVLLTITRACESCYSPDRTYAWPVARCREKWTRTNILQRGTNISFRDAEAARSARVQLLAILEWSLFCLAGRYR